MPWQFRSRREANAVRAARRRPSPARVVTVPVVVAIAALCLPTGSASTPVSAAPATSPRSICMVTATLDARPGPVLAMESFSATLEVRRYCRQRVHPIHIAFAVAISEEMQPRHRHDLQRTLSALIERMDRATSTTMRSGMVIAAGRATIRCPLSEDLQIALACMGREAGIHHAPGNGVRSALADASRMLEAAQVEPTEGEPRNIVMLMLVDPYESSSIPRSRAAGDLRASCSGAQSTASDIISKRILLVSTAIGWGHRRPSGDAWDCARGLATNSRYALPVLRLPVLFNSFVIEPAGPLRNLTTTIALPAHIGVDDAQIVAGWGSVQVDSEAIVVQSGFGGSEIHLVLRALRPGYHDLTGPVTITWTESGSINVRETRPPLGRILALSPRRLATATPPVISGIVR